MRLPNHLASAVSRLTAKNPKEHYWAARDHLTRLLRLRDQPLYAELVWEDQLKYLTGSVQPVQGKSREHAAAAAAWLIRAWQSTPDHGVSMGYFPCDPPSPFSAEENIAVNHGWRPSYPETTGYIIATLIQYANLYADAIMRERAMAMAHWEASIQMSSGAVQGGPLVPREQQTPAVFNTGMVLHGYNAILQTIPDLELYHAARGAADFLMADLGPDGHFKTHGPFVAKNRIKTYNCLCAWSLYRFGEIVHQEEYKQAAIRTAVASMKLQSANGWFPYNCLNRCEAPLTHTMGYTLQGLLETGYAAGREDLIDSARRGMTPLMDAMSPAGFLAGRFQSDWTPASFSSCLTGTAQLAVVCFRLFQILGDKSFLEAGHRFLNYLKGLQIIHAPNTPMQGALAGSFPMFLGEYMTAGFPNWATKYLLDALMLQDRLTQGKP
ncbi:MAG: hypothetical protein H7839_07905 [Magnetococcus sp. YQC-5]